ncbi:MAG: efflux RND transporter periplasmic adaptor subunit [Campylobacterota bacterium]|nr:efflux RND transporter periplasmic adaptor subunit [Campylobacterota bacterium]
MIKKILLSLLFLSTTALFAKTIELSATVISDNEKYITSRFMGFIKEVNVAAGDHVKKGKVLYSIDSTEIDNKKQQATLGVQMYQNQYLTMKQNYERFKRLYKKDLVSKFELEQLELGTKNLKDMVRIAQSQVAEVNNQYRYLTIVAPNDGVIIKKMIKAGEMAIPGMPAMVLTDLSSLKIDAQIAESDLKFIKKGQEVDIHIPSMDLKIKGEIRSIIPSSNPLTHTFTAKISFSTQETIYPGMYAKVFIDAK